MTRQQHRHVAAGILTQTVQPEHCCDSTQTYARGYLDACRDAAIITLAEHEAALSFLFQDTVPQHLEHWWKNTR